jgi:UDP-GlcNAc:undecaprenyl-phosphate/decaprenyl-phosphate GlcNAc-1-phosphate transferase
VREYVLALLIAAAATYLLTPLVRRGAIATRTMHAARTRDVHVVPTPLLGGVAMYGGLAAGLLVANQLTYLREAFPSPRTVPGLLLAGGLLVITGIIDDRWGMGAISKLAAQVAAGAILVWSQVVLSWVPEPSGGVFILPPQLGLTLTILLVVVTINAVNFIDGLDGLAAGIVAIAACSFLVYSYTLARVVGIHSQSVPALVAALLAGMCIGFLPHNFYPATIFMGDTGAMLLGLLLAYVPLSSTAMLDPSVLIHYSHTTVNRYPTILPLLLPAAILVIPYSDLLMAVVRRTRAGMSPFAADKKHLHHRLLSVGHSHRQSVLIMYLWAVLFTAAVVALSLVRTDLIVLVALTVVAVLVLLLVTMPRLRPGRLRAGGRRTRGTSRGTVPAGSGAHASGAAGTGPRPAMASPGASGNGVPGSAARPSGSPARPSGSPGSALPGRAATPADAPAGSVPAGIPRPGAIPGGPAGPGSPFPPRTRTPAAPQG